MAIETATATATETEMEVMAAGIEKMTSHLENGLTTAATHTTTLDRDEGIKSSYPPHVWTAVRVCQACLLQRRTKSSWRG